MGHSQEVKLDDKYRIASYHSTYSFLFSLTVHEFSHTYSALLLGDSTAKSLGRLTLNPLKHLDLLGHLP